MLLTVVVGDVLLHHQLVDRDHHLLVAHPHKQDQHHQHHLPEVYQLLLLLEALQLLQRRVHELIHLQQLSQFIQ